MNHILLFAAQYGEPVGYALTLAGLAIIAMVGAHWLDQQSHK